MSIHITRCSCVCVWQDYSPTSTALSPIPLPHQLPRGRCQSVISVSATCVCTSRGFINSFPSRNHSFPQQTFHSSFRVIYKSYTETRGSYLGILPSCETDRFVFFLWHIIIIYTPNTFVWCNCQLTFHLFVYPFAVGIPSKYEKHMTYFIILNSECKCKCIGMRRVRSDIYLKKNSP